MILIVSSTNRAHSNSRIIAGMYSQWLNDRSIANKILDLADLPHDFLFMALYEKAGKDARFNKFQEKIDEADKILFVVPEYNGSFPGILKSFFDGLRYPGTFDNKKVAFTSLSSGPLGGAIAISHLTDIMHYYNVPVLPVTTRIPFIDSLLDRDKKTLNESTVLELMREQIEAFIQF